MIKHLDFDSIKSAQEFEAFIKTNPAEISKKDRISGRTWLHEAVTHRDFFQYAEILIKHGANPQLKDRNGKTVLALCEEQLRSADLKQLNGWIKEYEKSKKDVSAPNENYNPRFLGSKISSDNQQPSITTTYTPPAVFAN